MTPVKDANKVERLKRGSNPPYIGLAEAFSLARGIYEQGGGTASYDVFSRLTGNSSSSSSFVKKVGALKAYGLAIEQSDILILTENGMAIAAPTSEISAASAKKAALLNISVFAKIYERHKGKLLPADEFLKNIIEQDSGIPKELSGTWVSAFKGASQSAGLLHTRPDGKTQIMESQLLAPAEMPSEPEANSPKTTFSPSSNGNSRVASVVPTTVSPLSASGNVTRFELSDGRVAEFNIPFGISAKDAKRLKSYLEGLKLIIDAATTEADDLFQT